MILKVDNSWETINELGYLSAVHFIHLNTEVAVHELQYALTIRNIEEIERKIDFLLKECDKREVPYKELESAESLKKFI